jgi:hypothetical protein
LLRAFLLTTLFDARKFRSAGVHQLSISRSKPSSATDAQSRGSAHRIAND